MADPFNPMLDDEDDYPASTSQAPQTKFRISRPSEVAKKQPAPAQAMPREPQFGEKGYRKGIPNPHKGSPRARVTEATAPLLAFVAKFPGATAEAASMVALTSPTNTGYAGGVLRTLDGTFKQLRKFERLGAADSYTTKGDFPVTHWGATGDGLVVAENFGYLTEPNEGAGGALADMALERLNHSRYIGLVAAHYASPLTPLRKELKIAPVALSQLVSEPQMRADFADVEWELKEARKEGKPAHWGNQREAMIKRAVEQIEKGVLEWSDLHLAFPLLRVIGSPNAKVGIGRAGTSYHIPDLVIDREAERKDRRARSILVEVELSKKSWDDYRSLFRMYAYEMRHRYVFNEVRYYTDRNDIANLLKKVDKSEETSLIENGFLSIHPLKNIDGDLVKVRRRTRD